MKALAWRILKSTIISWLTDHALYVTDTERDVLAAKLCAAPFGAILSHDAARAAVDFFLSEVQTTLLAKIESFKP